MTGNAGNVHAIDTTEVHLSERFSVDAWVRHKDTFRNKRLVLLFKVDVEFWANKSHDGLLVGLGTYDEHLVAQMENGVAVGDGQLALVYQT